MSSKKLSNTPPKGTQDWLPEEMKIRQYIFDTWRKICLRYGFQEYLTPLIENAAIYKAKSGEDIGGKELMVFCDKAGRELAIRPEMTPSVTRLVSKIYQKSQKPLKLFSIANFIRNEKPQRGRNREFWQLNFDIFGSESTISDIEIAQISLDIILEFKPPKDSFVFYINNRKLINALLENIKQNEGKKTEIIRTLDKWEKLSQKDFQKKLEKLNLNPENIAQLINFMESKNTDELIEKIPNLANNEGLEEIKNVINSLEKLGYADWIQFNSNMIRGFDYYDGIIYEVFDKHPDNNRSMFGGGRYNGLASIFGVQAFPSVGFAPGDETTKIFLESWGLLDKISETQKERFYLPILDENLIFDAQLLAQKLRKTKKNIEISFKVQKINKALDYAQKKEIENVIIFGEEENEKNIYKIKDMKTGLEKEIPLK